MTPRSDIFEYKSDILCIRGSGIVMERNPHGLIKLDLWRKWTRIGRLVQPGGNGRTSLIAFDSIPVNYQALIIQRYGNPKAPRNPLADHFAIDAQAKTFYDNYRLDDGSYLKDKWREEYTINASVLNAAAHLLKHRESNRKRLGNNSRGVWPSVANDVRAFNDQLLTISGTRHTLPQHDRKLRDKMNQYLRLGYASLINERIGNTNAQKVTPVMIKLWNDMFATQRHKPSYYEIAYKYEAFLSGKVEIVNSDTGEIYNRHDSESFRPISEKTVLNYLSQWQSRVVTHSMRSGDRQKFKARNEPYHKLKQPEYAGSIISVDDRQPPFEYAPGKRMWFYNAIDLGSEAFTCWVYGETKEGIILEFYRQLVRNYSEWGLPLPYELEGELSLNSSFKDTFLSPGSMFQEVRIEANNARGKRIEAFYRPLRYGLEKQREGWLARPFAISESNQAPSHKVTMLTRESIVQNALDDIETWNNTLHGNQELHPGLTRWEVFMEKQHPDLVPTNWNGILPYLGHQTTTSCNAGIIKLQNSTFLLGDSGRIATGDHLIWMMNQVEGKTIKIYWIDDNDGNVLKALIYLPDGQLVGEAVPQPVYSRSTLERTADEAEARTLMSAYVASIQSYIKRGSREIETITILQTEGPKQGKFTIRGLNTNNTKAPADSAPRILPDIEEEHEITLPQKGGWQGFNTSTASRF